MATWVAALIVMALWAIVALVLAKAGQKSLQKGDAAGTPDRRNREGGHPVGEEPDRIRAEIEQTRADMSETVDALGYKADVKSRAKETRRGRQGQDRRQHAGQRRGQGQGPAGAQRRAGEPARARHRLGRRRVRRRHADPVHARRGREARQPSPTTSRRRSRRPARRPSSAASRSRRTPRRPPRRAARSTPSSSRTARRRPPDAGTPAARSPVLRALMRRRGPGC